MATRIRGKNGNFVPNTKLNVVRHHVRSRKYALPVIGLIAVVGAIVLAISHASGSGPVAACAKQSWDDACVLSSYEAEVSRLYIGVFGRMSDTAGLNYWSSKLAQNAKDGSTGKSLSGIAATFVSSSEFQNKYGSLSNGDFVKAMYKQILRRSIDTNGFKYWTGKLNSGDISRAAFVLSFTESSEAKTKLKQDTISSITAIRDAKVRIATYNVDDFTCLGKKVYSVADKLTECEDTANITSGMVDQQLASFKLKAPLQNNERYYVCVKMSGTNSGSLPGFAYTRLQTADDKALSLGAFMPMFKPSKPGALADSCTIFYYNGDGSDMNAKVLMNDFTIARIAQINIYKAAYSGVRSGSSWYLPQPVNTTGSIVYTDRMRGLVNPEWVSTEGQTGDVATVPLVTFNPNDFKPVGVEIHTDTPDGQDVVARLTLQDDVTGKVYAEKVNTFTSGHPSAQVLLGSTAGLFAPGSKPSMHITILSGGSLRFLMAKYLDSWDVQSTRSLQPVTKRANGAVSNGSNDVLHMPVL